MLALISVVCNDNVLVSRNVEFVLSLCWEKSINSFDGSKSANGAKGYFANWLIDGLYCFTVLVTKYLIRDTVNIDRFPRYSVLIQLKTRSSLY